MIVTVAPAAASATTADAFCLSARIPTSDMCFIVAHVWEIAASVIGVVAVTAAAGAAFAWLQLRSGSILAPWLVHTAVNASTFLAVALGRAAACGDQQKCDGEDNRTTTDEHRSRTSRDRCGEVFDDGPDPRWRAGFPRRSRIGKNHDVLFTVTGIAVIVVALVDTVLALDAED